jgi:hypothetical protein
MKELLIKLGACSDARIWADNKSWKEIYETCERGDWLLWLYSRTAHKDIKRLTLAKAHCVNTVRHLMKDERSRKAVDVAIAFGEGKATKEELIIAYFAATAVYASYASYDVVHAVVYAVYISYAANAANAAAYAANAAASKEKNQRQTADICRKYLPFEIWEIKK